MSKQVAARNELIKVDKALLEQIQSVIDECLPVATKAAQSISDSLIIANGLNQMRTFFENPDVQKLVMSMKDSKLGFLTDSRPARDGRSPKTYDYNQISEAIIPMMLEGYRFTGNEINIINGQGMPVKSGKYRKIVELTDGFQHSVGTPQKEGGEKGVAKMKCIAKWKIGSQEYSIGYGDDICIIPVEYDKWAGLDKLIGLAESKLYSRVLTRITGKFVPEGEVTVTVPDENQDQKTSSIAEKFKAQQQANGKQGGDKTTIRSDVDGLLSLLSEQRKSDFSELFGPETIETADEITLKLMFEKMTEWRSQEQKSQS
jgi:hypothetical protein